MSLLSSRPAARRTSPGPIGLGLVFALLVAAGSARAALGAAGVGGAWTLILDEAHQCRLTLRSERAGSGHALAMPAGCHRAVPVLGQVADWSRASDGQVRFEDAGGSPVMTFEPGQEGLTATGPSGETYRLRPVDASSRGVLAAAATASAPTPTKAAPSTPPKLSTAKPADVAGRYAILRDQAKDTGCMLTLDDKARGPKNTFKARLAPACRDQGIIIFDPIGWSLESGRLVLTARKGHTTHLETQDDGSWMKDPKEGKSLSIKKM